MSGTAVLIACVCAALIGTEAWQLSRVYEANIRQAGAVTAINARAMAHQADTTIKTADTIAATLVERVEAEGTGSEARSHYYGLMTSLAAALPAIHEMGIIGSDGAPFVKSLVANPIGLNYAEREYFRYHAAHPDRGPFIGPPIKSKIDGNSAITVTRRFDRQDGSFGGVVVTSVSLGFFQQLFDEMQVKSGGSIALLSDSDAVLVHSPKPERDAPKSVGDTELRRLMRSQPLAGTLSYTSIYDGRERYGSYQHLADFPLVVMVSLSMWDIQRSFRAQLIWDAVILSCVAIVVAILGKRVLKANRLLSARAMQDGLTGLANRRTFDEVMQREFGRAAWSRQPLSIIMADIDNFKGYNDQYGHPAGDDCLRAVAHAIQSFVRRAGDIVARYGGEEISVVLPGLDAERTLILAEKMRVAVHDLGLPHLRSDHRVVTFSAGVATYIPGNSAGNWVTLLERADAALYAAKAKGRNAVELWSPPAVTLTAIDRSRNDVIAAV
jgi:diguanylate cyclase (GGDEF)-like protein